MSTLIFSSKSSSSGLSFTFFSGLASSPFTLLGLSVARASIISTYSSSILAAAEPVSRASVSNSSIFSLLSSKLASKSANSSSYSPLFFSNFCSNSFFFSSNLLSFSSNNLSYSFLVSSNLLLKLARSTSNCSSNDICLDTNSSSMSIFLVCNL